MTITVRVNLRRTALAIAVCVSSIPQSLAANDWDTWRELTSKEKAAIVTAVKDKLKDPDSAQFTWGKYNPSKMGYCGYVNAKNSFGGYTGKQLFSILFSDIEGEIIIGPVALDDAAEG